EDAADGAAALDLAAGFFGADEPQQAVFDEQPVADVHVADEVWIGRADASALADGRRALDDQIVANVDRHAGGVVDVLDDSEPDLRPAKVAENGDRLVPPRRRLADVAKHLQVRVERAVREVEPARIAAGVEELVQRLDVAAR